MRRLGCDTTGGVTMLVASAMPFVLAAMAAAVDIGAIALERRRMQAAVDAAALSAAHDLGRANARAASALSANRIMAAEPVMVHIGTMAAGSNRHSFVPGPAGDAVQVNLRYSNPSYFLSALGIRFADGRVSATASRRNLGAISIGSGLVSYDSGVVNEMTRAMTGSSVGLSLLSYQGLAHVDIDLFAFLDAVALRANLGVISYEQLLEQEIELPLLLRALGDSGAGGAFEPLINGINGTPRSIRMHDLIGINFAGAGMTGSRGSAALTARLRASDLFSAMLSLAGRNHAIALDLGASVPGLAGLKADIAIGESMQSSPWIAIDAKGGVEVSTAQARINLTAQIGPLLGLEVKLPLAVEIAASRAMLDALPCAPRDTAAVRAHAGVARMAIADLPVGTAIPTNAKSLPPARLIRAPLLSVDAVAMGALQASDWQVMHFTKADIAARQVKTVGTRDGVSTLLGTTLQSSRVDLHLLGLGLGIGLPGESQILSQIMASAPALERALFQLLALAGLQIGTAHVRVDGYRCGTPVLVA
ncbi:MAG: hypothetical protein CVT77_14365 [Alphaproteobacteria bacterium HGW-Alphaproteobacteria-16]|nr:MAG: hypothetical protein CVT77_14365 [Alphaproteobacteria bacterium HGW-Alphaproteobacteria-16]